MTVSDTHADTPALTIRYALDRWSQGYYVQPFDMRTIGDARTSLDALVAEVERERARADRAEAALALIAKEDPPCDNCGELDVMLALPPGTFRASCVAQQALAALSAGSGGRETTP